MLWVILIGGLIVIWGVAYYKPEWFNTFYETYVKEAWVAAVGIGSGVWEYVKTDTTWQQIIDPKYVPWALVGMAVLGIILRNINVKKAK